MHDIGCINELEFDIDGDCHLVAIEAAALALASLAFPGIVDRDYPVFESDLFDCRNTLFRTLDILGHEGGEKLGRLRNVSSFWVLLGAFLRGRPGKNEEPAGVEDNSNEKELSPGRIANIDFDYSFDTRREIPGEISTVLSGHMQDNPVGKQVVGLLHRTPVEDRDCIQGDLELRDFSYPTLFAMSSDFLNTSPTFSWMANYERNSYSVLLAKGRLPRGTLRGICHLRSN